MPRKCQGDDHVGPIQQFTECCLNCGRNIYDTSPPPQEEQKPRCPHKNVQQFTECCLDCGKNIYGP